MSENLTLEAIEGWMHHFSTEIINNEPWLTELDSAIGDGDHGVNMVRGAQSISSLLAKGSPDTIRESFNVVGMTLISRVGGASGTLYGTLFLEMSTSSPSGTQIQASEFQVAFRAGVNAVVSRGQAVIGDKTMIDTLEPASLVLTESIANGVGLNDSIAAAVSAANAGTQSTFPLVARKGRASYLGERSVDHIDPGAASAHILLHALHASIRAGSVL
ncbi:dihydroxyacetone kinase subunit DhaL [Glutamicibacter nicotianae]|uniref:dihydroxyacetone kinase subunit DhaL n=1 Tax=Glutamicibacter nicotianae TaxID=37929 RepID=UPI00195E8383|nr:dihydroxyacetone kinase subunit DhaL [Glutamicibacter nicotianae]MBM7769365.1 dihydroxyacetone kinase-like protein [Glutamicibacter nicotianae]